MSSTETLSELMGLSAASEVPSQVQSTLQLIASRLQRLENNSTDHPRPAVSSKAASPSTSGLSGSLSVSATLPSLRSDHEKPKFWGNTHYRHFFDQVNIPTPARSSRQHHR